MIRCAVLGSPISHSLSPLLHRAAYEELGIEGDDGEFEEDVDEVLGEGVFILASQLPVTRPTSLQVLI